MTQANLEQQQQQLELLGPAYVLEWTESQRHCSRRYFRSAEELRTDIQQQEKEPQRFEPRRRLLVLRELPLDYVQVLRDLLDIDAGFIDAHISRLSYRPLVRRRRDHGATRTGFVRFEYPELFTAPKGFTPDAKRVPSATGSRTRGDDNVEEPSLHLISDDGKGVLFCRASLWQCAKANGKDSITHNLSKRLLLTPSLSPSDGLSGMDSETSFFGPRPSSRYYQPGRWRYVEF